MVKKRANNWVEKQNNPLTRRITWYWFKEPETPKTISIKLYPRNAYEYARRKESFVSPYVSKHKTGGKEGYKDYTHKSYFNIVKKSNDVKYDKDKEYLNLNFLFDYLKDKIELSEHEKDILSELFNNWEIRKFLFEWNKKINQDLTYRDNIKVYDFDRDLIQAILTFYRCIFQYDEEFMFYFVFNRDIVKEYYKICKTIKAFTSPLNKDWNNRLELKDKIDSLYDTIPILYKKEQVIPIDTDDKIELEIIDYIEGTPKKNK